MPLGLTRTGARRSGDDYQDLVAMEVLVEFLETPKEYEWVEVETDDAGSLDDVVARKADGTMVAIQVKFSTDPAGADDAWGWKELLEQRTGKKGAVLPSPLEKWADSLAALKAREYVSYAGVKSNRRAAFDLKAVLSPTGLVDFSQIQDASVKDELVRQIGGLEAAAAFFKDFHFELGRPGLDTLEESLERRFLALGGTPYGWKNLKDALRLWVRNRKEPPPDGRIRLANVRSQALWYSLQGMPEEFEIPRDYVLPSEDFHRQFLDDLLSLPKGCMVLTASPGLGKSTYLSYLFKELQHRGVPAVRHHYYLSQKDRTVGRFDHKKVADSLMHDLQKLKVGNLGRLTKKNPNPEDLGTWLEEFGRHFAQNSTRLVVIIDGLDHVWRERGSIEELRNLFNHLLPIPDGVILVIGTQPIEDAQLPPRLLLSCPRDQWRHLPLLDLGAVRKWLAFHSLELELPTNKAHWFRELASAFYEKSHGHPLHLRYSLSSLQEEALRVTPKNIRGLPSCPHQDISQYYQELWISLTEDGKAVLHLLAACEFPWPKEGIVACLGPQETSPSGVRSAIKKVAHLLTVSPMGMQPFHSSLLVFVRTQGDHQDYSAQLKRKALTWIRDEVPDYWKWAYEWIVEADLGNEQPLMEGPNRDWVIDSIAKGRPHQQVSDILARSGWLSLKACNLPRFVEVILLRDYYNAIVQYHRDLLDKALYCQMATEVNLSLEDYLSSTLHDCRHFELSLLAEKADLRGNKALVSQCFEAARRELTYETGFENLVRILALTDDPDISQLIRFANANKDVWSPESVLRIFSEALRTARKVTPLRKLAARRLQAPVKDVVLRNVFLLACEEGIDLSDEIKSPGNLGNAFVGIEAALRGDQSIKFRGAMFPSISLLSVPEYDIFRYENSFEELFYSAFFCLLSNHMWGLSALNNKWLTKISCNPWLCDFFYKLNDIALECSELLLSHTPSSFASTYGQMSELDRPSWHEDSKAHQYSVFAERALHSISLDLRAISQRVGAPPTIKYEELEMAFNSGYCNPWVWLNNFISRRRSWLDQESLTYLLQRQELEVSSRIDHFPERADRYLTLASLAALHGADTKALDYLSLAASNMLAYGEHKDILLYEALEIVQAGHQNDKTSPRKWLLDLAPAIAAVREFTDGDETSHLPREFGVVLSQIAYDLLPQYHEWLCRNEEYDDALAAFHAFLEVADLNIETNQVLAKSAVDDVSISIIRGRSDAGDEAAKSALEDILDYLGAAPKDATLERTEEVKASTISRTLPPPGEYPPDRIKELLSSLKAQNSYLWDGCLDEWIDYWTQTGRSNEVFEAIKMVVFQNPEIGSQDKLYELAYLVDGRTNAYDWLVRAHIERWGWNQYVYKKSESVSRWSKIKNHYPEKWMQFIQDTMSRNGDPPWRALSVDDTLERLVEYCFYIGQAKMAESIATQVIKSTLDLVSPLNLVKPDWVKNDV